MRGAGDTRSAGERSAAARAREIATFDALAASPEGFDPFLPEGWAVLGRRFLAASPPAQGWVVDVGCGSGASRGVYSSVGGRYLGIDLSLVALDRARQHPGRRERWLRADALRLPLADGTAAVVAFSSVLHHLPDLDAALAEARRALRPGGLVFAFDPNLLHPAMALFRHPRSPFYVATGVSPDERPLAPSVLRSAFAAAGFVHIGQRGQSGIAYRAVAPRGFQRGLAIFNLVDRGFEAAGLGRWFGTFVVTWGRCPGDLTAPA